MHSGLMCHEIHVAMGTDEGLCRCMCMSCGTTLHVRVSRKILYMCGFAFVG